MYNFFVALTIKVNYVIVLCLGKWEMCMRKKNYVTILLFTLSFACPAVNIPFNFSWISFSAKKFLFLPLRLPMAAFMYVRDKWGCATPRDVAENLKAQKNFYNTKFD